MTRTQPLAEPLLRIEGLRARAAFFSDAGERQDALSRHHDLDSFAFVAERSPYPDTRAAAEAGLRARLSSFTTAVLRHLQDGSESQTVRSCASSLLSRRLG